MTPKFTLAGAALAAAFAIATAAPGMAASPASALAPLKPIGLEQSQIEKTHGWHRRCRRGLNGWHRHVRGVGRIQCTTAKNCYTNVFGYRMCDWF